MSDDRLTVASFFSGIGLLDLGLEWAGWRTVSFSEIEPYASARLAQRFPGVPNLGDIHAIEHVPDATLWAGGFPCQPVSVAGSQRAQDDHRWLWPVWAGLIRQFRPPLLLLENVPNLLAVNDGGAFGDVLGDLAAIGYDAEWDCIPAAAVGAPHLRDRVWIVATHTERNQLRHEPVDELGGSSPAITGDDGPSRPVADAEGEPLWPGLRAGRPGGQWRGRPGDGGGPLADPDGPRPQGHRGRGGERHRASEWAPGAGSGPITDWWLTEPDVGRVAHGVPSRVDRLRCLGNGVVPQVAEFLGWRIRRYVEGT